MLLSELVVEFEGDIFNWLVVGYFDKIDALFFQSKQISNIDFSYKIPKSIYNYLVI